MYTIMMVDDNETELVIAQRALEKEYNVIPMNSGKAALTRLAKSAPPDLILLDIGMPGINGFEMIMRIKTSEKTKNIPVIFLSGEIADTTELECYRLGGVDFIRKPVVVDLLRKRIEIQLELLEYKRSVGKQTSKLSQTASYYAQEALELEYFIIGVITDLLSIKDANSGTHTIGVSKYMEILLREVLLSGINYGIDVNDFEIILLSSRLHDMGKIGVPDYILKKQDKYTDEEYKLMQMHTVYAANAIDRHAFLLKGSKFLTYSYQMCRYHHEWFNGMGYPDKISGQSIPILARILAVADTYEALTAFRAYHDKPPRSHEEAFNIITQGAGVQFDPQVVAAFQRVHNDIAQTKLQLDAYFMQHNQNQQGQQGGGNIP